MGNREQALRRKLKQAEEALRAQDERLVEKEKQIAAMEDGTRQVSQVIDAILVTIVLEFGTGAPLGRRLEIPEVKVKELAGKWNLHAVKLENGSLELTILDRAATMEAEERMQ